MKTILPNYTKNFIIALLLKNLYKYPGFMTLDFSLEITGFSLTVMYMQHLLLTLFFLIPMNINNSYLKNNSCKNLILSRTELKNKILKSILSMHIRMQSILW